MLRDHGLGCGDDSNSAGLTAFDLLPRFRGTRADRETDRRLDIMSDPFAVRELRIRQPARVLPGRARYDIFDSDRTLLAVAAETTPRSVLQTMADLVPRTRTIRVRSA